MVYLPSCSIQCLSYTRVVLSPYLYLSSFSFSWCTFFAIIISSFSPFQVSILPCGKLLFFCIVQGNSFLQFFLCPLKYLAFPFLFIIRSFLFVSFRLFINLYIVSLFFILMLSLAFLLIFPHMLGLPNLAPS